MFREVDSQELRANRRWSLRSLKPINDQEINKKKKKQNRAVSDREEYITNGIKENKTIKRKWKESSQSEAHHLQKEIYDQLLPQISVLSVFLSPIFYLIAFLGFGHMMTSLLTHMTQSSSEQQHNFFSDQPISQQHQQQRQQLFSLQEEEEEDRKSQVTSLHSSSLSSLITQENNIQLSSQEILSYDHINDMHDIVLPEKDVDARDVCYYVYYDENIYDLDD